MRHFILMLLLLVSTALVAQKYQDVIYLKNGSIIKGLIIEQVPNESVKIKSGSNFFVYRMDEIEKLTKEARIEESGQKEGIHLIAEIGAGFGIGDTEIHSMKVNVIGAYRFNPYFSAGLGTGFRGFFDTDINLLEPMGIPAFVDLRVTPLNKPISPYLAVAGGYLLGAGKGDFEYGALINSSIGVSIKTSEKLFLNFGLGYDYQSITITQVTLIPLFGTFFPIESKLNTSIHALSINIGISF